jgi:hypothetical protein
MTRISFANRTTLALAVAAALPLMATSQQTAAAVYGGALLETTNLVINITPAQTVTALSYDFVLTNTATLNGGSSPTQEANCDGETIPTPTTTCGTAPGVPALNAAQAWAPGASIPAVAEDTYSFIGPNDPNASFARADSIIDTSQATGDDFTSTRNLAEAEIQTRFTPQSASSSSEISSTTGITFSFTVVGGPANFQLSFQAVPALRVQIDPEAILPASANAEVSWNATISRDDTGSSVEWEPNGNVADNCDITNNGDFGLVTCVEDDDDWDLNRQLQISSINSLVYSPGSFGDFGFSVAGLPEGNYTLQLDEFKSVDVNNSEEIPAPGILSLMGLGLFGLGWGRRRRGA